MMFLGLDLGTTNVKALVVDSAGQSLAHASAPVGLSHVGAAGVEQDIEEIERAALAAMRQVAQRVDPAGIAAIGISSQGGAMQILDAHSRPVGRVISWLDQRGRPFDQAIFAELGREWFLSRIRRGCSGLAIGQLLRLRHESPELLRAPNRVGFVGDIIVSRLCGRAAHDGTSCGLTLLYNPELRSWDPELLQRLQLDPRQLPELISPRAIAGGLRADMARETGLRAGIPVSAAIHDQYASALGSGAVRAGTVMVGTGTAWVLLAVNDRLAAPVIDEAFVCNHVVEGLCGQILSLVNGGSSFTWALQLTGLSGKDHGEIETLLESTRPGSAGLCFWPFLVSAGVSGLAPGTQGRLSGLQLVHRPADVLRGVIEGLACELNRYLGFLRAALWPVERLVMGGGAAGSHSTTQIIADVTGVPLACLENSETSLLGAAILARGLVEARTSLAELTSAMVPPARLVEPGAEKTFYQGKYEQYLSSLPLQQARPT
ncbi:MAG: xylulokinase [Pirellulaceae bacterium]